MTKIISVSDHVYGMLSRLKGGRSFSKMLEELAERDVGRGDIGKLRPFFGSLSKMNLASRLKYIKKRRSEFGSRRLK